MKLLAPKYYSKFKCIADKCSHSCCVGWEIDVDSDTYRKYTSLNHEYKAALLDSIEETDTPHFRLGEGERCPHLDNDGLCKIIRDIGEDYLCQICREHPRFYVSTPYGTEVGLGMACEEACRIILSSDEYDSFEEIETGDYDAHTPEFNALSHRQRIFSLLKSDTGYDQKLQTIYEEYGVNPLWLEKSDIEGLFASIEYLDSRHKSLFSEFSPVADTPEHLEKPLERALAYFIFRHCTEALDIQDFCASLGLALFCERLLCYVATKLNNVSLAARIISEELEYSQENTERIMLLFCE